MLQTQYPLHVLMAVNCDIIILNFGPACSDGFHLQLILHPVAWYMVE